MKRISALLIALVMMLTMVPAMAEEVTGTAKGFGGDVTVTLTIENGVITAAKAEGANETPGVGTPALEQLPAAMVAGNTVNVDVMGGATFTSNGVIEAAKAALTAAGLKVEDYMTKAEAVKAEDAVYEADIVIVGAGGAGMTSALTAAESGAKVIIVESQAAVGGNSVRATGGMNAGETTYQDKAAFGQAAGVDKTLASVETTYADHAVINQLADIVEIQWAAYQQNAVGYFDSVELMQLDTMIGGKGINDPALVKLLAENSAEGVEWLRQFDIDLVNTGAFGGASVNRIHWPKVDGKKASVGAYMIPLLEDACEANENITILFETTANEIIMVDGAAKGIKATGKTGNTVTVNADAVILATGGFGANLEMVAELKPELEGFMTTNAAGLQGQGIAMAQAVGAAVVDMDQIQIHPTVEANTASLITEGLRGDGAILVNAEGKRFIDEVGTRDVVSAAEIAQTGSYSWLIVDQRMLDASATIAGYVKKNLTVTGATYEELAAATGMPAAAFAETMNAWNG